MHVRFLWCFFFQAEDGIRDGRVTGVQTCALPISRTRPRASVDYAALPKPVTEDVRSEERRVGKGVDLGGRRIIKKKKKKKKEKDEKEKKKKKKKKKEKIDNNKE